MKNKKYEDLPLSLALFDGLPVVFFSVAMIIIAMQVQNILFVIGAILCSLAGLGKVVWKIIIAATKKDYQILNRQLRVVMPIGFVLLIIGVVTQLNKTGSQVLLQKALSFPTVILFSITVIGMILMSVFAFTLDATKKRSHWIEQITNAIAQGCLLLGILSCL